MHIIKHIITHDANLHHGVEDGQTEVSAASLAGRGASDHLCAVLKGLLRMEGSLAIRVSRSVVWRRLLAHTLLVMNKTVGPIELLKTQRKNRTSIKDGQTCFPVKPCVSTLVSL